MSNNGATSGNNGVRRTLSRKIYEQGALARCHPSVKEMDRKIAKVILTSCVSWTLIDNEAFGELCSELLGGRYNLPSRYYIQENVMKPMFEETKAHIKKELKKQVHIGLTTDAWTSTTQQSYITVTAHIIDEKCNLKSYVLDTSEITTRHTSENLIVHIENVLTEYEINTKNDLHIIYNFNATNPDNVHEQDKEQDHEVNYLVNDTEVTHVVELNADNVIESESQTQELFFEDNPNENVSLSRNSSISRQNSFQLQLSENESIQQNTPPSGSTTPRSLLFVSDNANDITKALSGIGGYERFGCAAHHLNLVGQAGFKNVQAAAALVRRCKRIVEHIKSSTPATYILIEYEKEFEVPLLKVLQENNTRWWTILLMMERMLVIFDQITLTLCSNNRRDFVLTPDDKKNMCAIVALLKPFKECGEKLSSEKDVTISLIIPYFQILKDHLMPNTNDVKLIKDMKSEMLQKLNSRYNSEQLKCLTISTLLDVRHKNDVTNGFELLKTALQNFVVRQQEQEQSQNEIIPVTQGQELENISGNIVRNNSKSIFAFKDDEIHDEPGRQMDAVVCELINYNNVKLYAKVKEKILAKNVNKAILLKANVQHISPNTTVLNPQDS